MATGLISSAWDESKTILSRDGKLFVSVALALIVLPEVIAAVVAPRSDASGARGIATLLTGLIGIIAQLAMIRLALGPSTTVGASIGHGARRCPAAIGALLLLMVLMVLICFPFALVAALMGVQVPTVGGAPGQGFAMLLLVLIVVMLAVGVRFMMTSTVASAETVGPLGIMKRSWALTRDHYWPLFGLVVSLFLVLVVFSLVAAMLGGIAARLVSPDIQPFSAGALVVGLASGLAQGAFSILSSLMLARVYARLSSNGPSPSVPSSGG